MFLVNTVPDGISTRETPGESSNTAISLYFLSELSITRSSLLHPASTAIATKIKNILIMLITPSAENGRSYSYHGGTFLHRFGEITRHAHGKFRKAYTVLLFGI